MQYSLGAFGISEKSLPVDQSGYLDSERHTKYVEQLRLRELQDASPPPTPSPTNESGDGEEGGRVNSVSTESPETESLNQRQGNTPDTDKNENNILSRDTETPADTHNAKSSSTTSTRDGIIQTPNANDVLLGRGKFCQSHHGTVEFNKLVEKYRMQYQTAQTHIEKTTINQLIVQIIHEKNGRFLQRDKASGQWKEVSIEIAWERVGRRYRK